MRCSVVVRSPKGRERPCEHPAVVAYLVDGAPYPRCQRHDSQEVRRYAERYQVRTVPA